MEKKQKEFTLQLATRHKESQKCSAWTIPSDSEDKTVLLLNEKKLTIKATCLFLSNCNGTDYTPRSATQGWDGLFLPLDLPMYFPARL